jgi:2-polyprenyl-6-methoxyphenol hydroxylase-like FAD-dependent oxidoreductase
VHVAVSEESAVDVLISGASVAGPVTAYWLRRSGFRVTVVERAPALRKTGGHAVDLFAPALDIVERMGLVDRVEALRTGTERMVVLREGARRPSTIDLRKLMAGFSRRHVEIMRDDLSEVFYNATRDDVEYVFGDHVTGIGDDGEVTFANGRPRRFDLVIGADGLHSGVRGLVFGPESAYTRWIGGYIAVASIPNYLDLRNEMRGFAGVNRLGGLYSAQHMTDARAMFLFRTPAELSYDRHDGDAQRRLLREQFGDLGWEIPRLLDETDRASAFYFDSITQLRLEHWTRGRVALVGDAGYCPGPAVGGSTSLAVVGAYTLAGELAAAGGDPARAYPAYEAALGEYVRSSRTFAVTMAKRIVPTSRAMTWAMTTGVQLFTALPTALARRIGTAGATGLHESVAVRDYPELTGAP